MSDTLIPALPSLSPELKKSLTDQKARIKLLKQGLKIQKQLGANTSKYDKLLASAEKFMDDALDQSE